MQHQTVECKFCGHHYIEPCSTKVRADKCGNIRIKAEEPAPKAKKGRKK